jgi:hypothetical protein
LARARRSGRRDCRFESCIPDLELSFTIMEDKPLLSISDTEGIKIHVKKGDSITTMADSTFMKGIAQTSVGGTISHTANNLTQIGGSQRSENGGSIKNKSQGGNLYQEGVQQTAADGGRISNETDTSVIKADSMKGWWNNGWLVTIVGGLVVVIVGTAALRLLGLV